MAELPWNAALLEANQRQTDRLVELEAENTRLKVTIANLQSRLRRAKHVHENWLLRQRAWRDERNELLARLQGVEGVGQSRREREVAAQRFRD